MLQILTTVTQEQTAKSGDIQINEILKSIEIPEVNLFLDEDCINCPFDVTNFLPTWLVDEHNSGNTLFVKFIQHYFDWLYCTGKSDIYMNNVFDLFDIENITEKTRDSILKTYLPGFREAIARSSTVYIGDTVQDELVPNHPFKVFGSDVDQQKYPGTGWFWPMYMAPPTDILDEFGNPISYHVHRIRWSPELNMEYPGDRNSLSGTYTFYMPSVPGNMTHAFIDDLDYNGDGVVDGQDLGLFLTQWGTAYDPIIVGPDYIPTGDAGPADINNDGVVDGNDFGLFLARWGSASNYPTWDPTFPAPGNEGNLDKIYAISYEKIKKLLKNVKHNIYQRKTTKGAIRYLFQTLFGDQVNVSVDTSKAANIDIRITGAPRNSNDFLNFCKDVYEAMLHPVGMSYTLLLDSSPITYRSQRQDERDEQDRSNYEFRPVLAGATLTAYEFPLLGNYYVYHSDDISTIAPVSGCYPGGTADSRGITADVSNLPTFTHPNWYYGVSGGTSFGDINISSMMMIPFEDNPNIGITSCANL